LLLAELLSETGAAIAKADRTVLEQNALSLDLGVTAAETRQARDLAFSTELTRDRLKLALPKLKDLLQSALADECAERWLADYHKVEPQATSLPKLFRS